MYLQYNQLLIGKTLGRWFSHSSRWKRRVKSSHKFNFMCRCPDEIKHLTPNWVRDCFASAANRKELGTRLRDFLWTCSTKLVGGLGNRIDFYRGFKSVPGLVWTAHWFTVRRWSTPTNYSPFVRWPQQPFNLFNLW